MLKINETGTKATLIKFGAEDVSIKIQYICTYSENRKCHEYKITLQNKTRRQHSWTFYSLEHARIDNELVNDILANIEGATVYANLESFCINFSYPVSKESEQIYNKHQRHAKRIIQLLNK